MFLSKVFNKTMHYVQFISGYFYSSCELEDYEMLMARIFKKFQNNNFITFKI